MVQVSARNAAGAAASGTEFGSVTGASVRQDTGSLRCPIPGQTAQETNRDSRNTNRCDAQRGDRGIPVRRAEAR